MGPCNNKKCYHYIDKDDPKDLLLKTNNKIEDSQKICIHCIHAIKFKYINK